MQLLLRNWHTLTLAIILATIAALHGGGWEVVGCAAALSSWITLVFISRRPPVDHSANNWGLVWDLGREILSLAFFMSHKSLGAALVMFAFITCIFLGWKVANITPMVPVPEPLSLTPPEKDGFGRAVEALKAREGCVVCGSPTGVGSVYEEYTHTEFCLKHKYLQKMESWQRGGHA